jgi:hypothetical protein
MGAFVVHGMSADNRQLQDCFILISQQNDSLRNEITILKEQLEAKEAALNNAYKINAGEKTPPKKKKRKP